MTIGNDGPPNQKTEPALREPAGQVPLADHIPQTGAPAASASAPEREPGASPSDVPLPEVEARGLEHSGPGHLCEEASAHESERETIIRAALNRVLSSSDLRGSPRLATFLRYVVETTLAGRAEQIKGYTIAVEALERPPTFDPQADPIVRVEATRLRRALQSYYAGEGIDDPLRIHIPKGGYVPSFEMQAPPEAPASTPDPAQTVNPAAVPAAPAAEPSDTAMRDALEAEAEPAPAGAPLPGGMPTADVLPFQPRGETRDGEPGERESTPAAWAISPSLEVEAVSPQKKRAGTWIALLATAAVVVTAVMAILALPLVSDAFRGPVAQTADKVVLPLVTVGRLEGESPKGVDLHRLAERMRDAFAQFDFVETRANLAGDEGVMAAQCAGPGARSVFSLDGLAVPAEDGQTALMLHLTDHCAGVIVWSKIIDGLGETASQQGETQIANSVATALAENYGVIPVRARSRALAQAPHSGFGCIAEAFAVLRGDGSASSDVPRACLAELTLRDREFALGHAVRAAALLDEAVRSPDPISEADAAMMLHEAELAADLAPSSAFAARTLAQIQMFLGETQTAMETAERALRLNPLDLDVAATAGQIFIAAGEVDKGEALLMQARSQGVARSPLQETYLAFAAFLRRDAFAAQALMPQLSLHPSPQNRIALALALQMLGRGQDAHALVRTLTEESSGSSDAVRRLVQHLLPAREVCQKVLAALESAGLGQSAGGKNEPRG